MKQSLGKADQAHVWKINAYLIRKEMRQQRIEEREENVNPNGDPKSKERERKAPPEPFPISEDHETCDQRNGDHRDLHQDWPEQRVTSERRDHIG